ncbi:MAG: DUF5312 family protein [Spirochaetales bacterium]
MGGSFFSDIFSRIMNVFGSNDTEADKKRYLKKLSKELSQTKIKFYKYSSDEALPQMAKFFFELYKIVGPAQNLFKNVPSPNIFKNMVVDYYLTDEQKEFEMRLSEEAILENSKKMSIKDLSDHVNKDLATYFKIFDEEKIAQIDMAFTRLSLLLDFCTFDYYFFLKKFDSSMQEDNFTYVPQFSAIRAEYIIEDLKEFIEVAWAMPLEGDWNEIFAIIKHARGIQPIQANVWNKMLQKLRKFRNSGVFEIIIQLIAKDPGYRAVITEKQERIIDAQLETIKKNAVKALHKVQSEQKNSKIDGTLNAIFGTTTVVRLKYYTDDANKTFDRKSLDNYAFVQPLNYLKAFVNDYFKKEVREFIDLVLVRGQWVTSELANPLSEAYHRLLNLSEQITLFDESLSEEKEIGVKIKTYFARADRDKEAKNILKTLIRDANEKSHGMLVTATRDFIVVATNVKTLLEDFDKKKPELLINWAEVTRFTEHSIKDQGLDVYKKIYHFVNLMKLFLSK